MRYWLLGLLLAVNTTKYVPDKTSKEGPQDVNLQVDHRHAHNYKQLLPKSHLQIIEDGGHIAYWACDTKLQRQMLKQLIEAGLPS